MELNESREFEVKKELEEKRKDIHSFEDLVKYLENVKNNYNCGYGEAPRAIAQAALATAWYLAGEFGITGFQAGFVMWDFIFGWTLTDNKCGAKIVDYDNMLYPQYDDKFEKTISRDVFEQLRKRAVEEIADVESAHSLVSPAVLAHWQSIADGVAPFGYKVVER